MIVFCIWCVPGPILEDLYIISLMFVPLSEVGPTLYMSRQEKSC